MGAMAASPGMVFLDSLQNSFWVRSKSIHQKTKPSSQHAYARPLNRVSIRIGKAGQAFVLEILSNRAFRSRVGAYLDLLVSVELCAGMRRDSAQATLSFIGMGD